MAPLVPLAAVAICIGAVLAVTADRRLWLVAGWLSAVVPIPLMMPPDPLGTSWTLAASVHLVASLLSGFLFGLGAAPDGRTTGGAAGARDGLPSFARMRGALPAALLVLGAFSLGVGVTGGSEALAATGGWLDPAALTAGCAAALGVAGAVSLLGRHPVRPAMAAALLTAALLTAAQVLVGRPSDAALVGLAAVSVAAAGLASGLGAAATVERSTPGAPEVDLPGRTAAGS